MRLPVSGILFGLWFSLLICPLFADTRFYLRDCQIPVPDKGQGTLAVSLQITDHLLIKDVDVYLNISHEYVNELVIILESPQRERISLKNFQSTWREKKPHMHNTIIDDSGILWEEASPPYSTRIRPPAGQYLSGFNDSLACGTWNLQIYDDGYKDSGILESWGLSIEGTSMPEPCGLFFAGMAFVFSVFKGASRRGRNR